MVAEVTNGTMIDNQQAMEAFRQTLDMVDSLENSLVQVAQQNTQAAGDAITNFTLLKQNLWQINSLVNQSKTLNNEIKSAVDVEYLDIHNVLYQHLHFKEEINQCNSYSSIFDLVNLVPVEEFLETKREELESQITNDDSGMEDIEEKGGNADSRQGSSAPSSSITAMEAYFEKLNSDPHFLMIERLKDEDKRRRDISLQLSELEVKIKELTSQNKGFSEDLGSLDSVINEFVKNSSKIDEVLIKH